MSKVEKNILDLEDKLQNRQCFIFEDTYNTKLKKELLLRRFSFYTFYDKTETERYIVAWYEGKKYDKYAEMTELLGVKMFPVDESVKTFEQLCKRHFDMLDAP